MSRPLSGFSKILPGLLREFLEAINTEKTSWRKKMSSVDRVLCTVKYDEERLEKIKRVFFPAPVCFFDPGDTGGIRSIIHDVDVAVLNSDLDEMILEGEKLKWIHCSHSGLTKSARKMVFDRNIILTGAAGRSAPSLAEHAFFFAISLTYDVYRLHEAQKEHNWDRFSKQYANSRGLNGKTMGIVGFGHTGQEVAKRARAFDMRVLVYSRSVREKEEYVDEYFAQDRGENLDVLLREADYLVLCCHLSDETYHMIGSDALKKMKGTAFLINMARGPVVDEKALYSALKDKVIAGAGCDVFDVEPLPSDNPLWDLPNIMITPHSTPRVPSIFDNALNILLENIERYKKDEPLLNRLSERDMYTK
jgi:phosphoglycerate dehydrogenase-like enzyme